MERRQESVGEIIKIHSIKEIAIWENQVAVFYFLLLFFILS